MSTIEFCNRLGAFLETSPGRIRFRHALVRDTAYEGLSYRRRRELHGIVGDAIVADAGDDADVQAPLLSFHFFAAQRYDEAWRCSSRAGRRAKSMYANVEAETLLLRAVESARRLGGVPVGELSATLEALGEVRVRLADYERGDRALAGGSPPAARRSGRVCSLDASGGCSAIRRARFGHAVRWVRRGLRTIEHDSDGPRSGSARTSRRTTPRSAFGRGASARRSTGAGGRSTTRRWLMRAMRWPTRTTCSTTRSSRSAAGRGNL